MDSKDYKDEPKVMRLMRERLEGGYNQYGSLDLALDSRDLVTEALEEALDLSIYLSSRLLQIRMYERINNEDEFLATVENLKRNK